MTPDVSAIRWDVSGDGLFELCTQHWPLLEPELKRLQYEHDHGRPMTDDERQATGEKVRRNLNDLLREDPVATTSTAGDDDLAGVLW